MHRSTIGRRTSISSFTVIISFSICSSALFFASVNTRIVSACDSVDTDDDDDAAGGGSAAGIDADADDSGAAVVDGGGESSVPAMAARVGAELPSDTTEPLVPAIPYAATDG